MPHSAYKGKNHRCKRDRFIDSNGVPHDPAERGTLISFPVVGSPIPERQRIHAGRAGDAPASTIDYRELGEGVHVIRWHSGITTAVKLVADPETGRCRVVSLDDTDTFVPPLPVPAEFETTREYSFSDKALPERLQARLSRTLRRRIDEVRAAKAAERRRDAAQRRKQAQREAKRS